MPSEMVDITTPDGVADAYLSRPDEGEHPGVLFLIDAFGVRPAIETMVDRIAARGYTVLAPNTLYRIGRSPVVDLEALADPDRRDEVIGGVMPAIRALSPKVARADGGAYLDYLDTVARAPFAITGYCMGGRLGWMIAAAYPERVAALGAFHTGGLVTEEPNSPHLSAGDLQAELFLGHADNDRSMTAEHIDTVERALDEAGVRYRSELFAGAGHGYTMSDTPVYDEAAAERHFDELFALLERTLGARV